MVLRNKLLPGLVPGESLSLSTKIDSVIEKYLSYNKNGSLGLFNFKIHTAIHFVAYSLSYMEHQINAAQTQKKS